MDKKTDDDTKRGIYGARPIQPNEWKQFLGTLRERVILVLTTKETMRGEGMKELEEEMKKHPHSKLLFNGTISSKFFKTYKQLANKQRIKYTTITNRDAVSELGLVLTSRTAVEKEKIHLEETEEPEIKKQTKATTEDFSSFLKKTFQED